MYPQPQGQSTLASVTAGTSITVSSPDSSKGVAYKVGDFILFALRGQSSTTTAVALPSGVSRLGPAFIASSANYRVTGMYGYRVLGDSFGAPVVPASFTFGLTGSSNNRIVLIAQVVRQVAATPVAAFYDSYFGVAQTAGVRVPSYSTTADGMTFVIAASEFAANNSETPTVADNDYGTYGYTVAPATLSSGRTAVGLYAREQAPGSTNEFLMQWGTPSGQAAQSVTLAGGAWESTTPPSPTPLAVKWYDGTILKDGVAKWYDGSSLRDVAQLIRVRPGRKVDHLFEGVAKIAHRMGSLNYREMSMRGATQSAIAGATALEFSVARTSDGVYFGLHDTELNRTTPSLGVIANGGTAYKPGDHTWAEISQLAQTAPSTNDTRFGDQPYQRLDSVLNVYAQSHTFFIDPKVIGSAYWDELLDYLLTFPDARNTFVIKYFHTGVTLADKARARGFRTWGYGYQTDVDGSPQTQLSATAARWDYIGMDYQANDAAWASTRAIAAANGNKIIGHICPSVTAAQRCIDQGAVGVMCSGINEVAGWNAA